MTLEEKVAFARHHGHQIDYILCNRRWRGSIQSASLVTSLVAQMVKHLPTMRETQVQSLGQEGLLEKEMATHSSKYSCLENPMDGGT